MNAVASKSYFVAMPPLPGRPVDPGSESARRPWVAAGISKRTFYRRKAAGLIRSEQDDAHVEAWLASLSSMARLDHLAFARRCRIEATRAAADSGEIYGLYLKARGVS